MTRDRRDTAAADVILRDYVMQNANKYPIAQSTGAVEYTDCFSATSVQIKTLNNLMVRFQ